MILAAIDVKTSTTTSQSIIRQARLFLGKLASPPGILGHHNMRVGLYAYVNGSDCHEFASPLLDDLNNLRDNSSFWMKVVDDRFEKTPDMEPDDLPDWNLGINVLFDDVSVEALTELFAGLETCCAKYGRAFAIGYVDLDGHVSEDITFLEAGRRPNEVAQSVLQFLGK